jgi:CRP/FNR family transcriptional regulator, cyclic AMP receptor protein
LLILRKGLVEVAKEGVEIARVTDPGAVFGEISALLDQPHSADVRALTSSQFHVADAAALLQDPAVLLYYQEKAAVQEDYGWDLENRLQGTGSGSRSRM